MKITIETGEWSRRRTIIGFLGVAAIAAVAVVVVLLVAGGGTSHASDAVTLTNSGASMEPTLRVGQRLKVNLDAELAVGDIVVFHPPAGVGESVECYEQPDGYEPLEIGESCPESMPVKSQQLFVKRIVAAGGDTLSIKNGRAVVNGFEGAEPFIKPCGGGYECNLPKTITIPEGDVFLLGDNRGESDDSRYWGPIPARWIVGRVEE
jgi:signal peptidase I